MWPAAEFTGPIPEGDDPDKIAVLLIEERDRAGFDCLVERQLLDSAHQVGADLGVEQPGNAIDLVSRQRAWESEIEGRVVRLDRRASLACLLAEDIAKGPVQQVRGRVMPRHGLAPRGIHRRVDPIAGLQPVGGNLDPMRYRLALWLDVEHA